eukprot:gene28591-37559_t
MTNTHPHPWKIALFPSTNGGFCKLGCQLFYIEVPKNTTCKRLCNYFYRYKITTGYSDIAEEAKLECQDGCEIALQVCEAGYYCSSGEMLPCPPGKYREPVTDVSLNALSKASECTLCPYGRYRPASKGMSPDDCTKCPRGKYANSQGLIQVSECQRCPAGKFAEDEGMRLCKCINEETCNFKEDGVTYFNETINNGLDFNRETVPFIGRW